jgi:putative holliday junction resolvase
VQNRAPSLGRILGIDLGKKRIGLAVSDPLRITVQGLETFHRGRVREDLDALARLIEEREVTWIVFGDPKNMDGSVSPQQEYTREFGGRLAARSGVGVDYWDERLTSWEASRILRSSGKGSTKGAIDQMSAVLILESYLEHLQA